MYKINLLTGAILSFKRFESVGKMPKYGQAIVSDFTQRLILSFTDFDATPKNYTLRVTSLDIDIWAG